MAQNTSATGPDVKREEVKDFPISVPSDMEQDFKEALLALLPALKRLA